MRSRLAALAVLGALHAGCSCDIDQVARDHAGTNALDCGSVSLRNGVPNEAPATFVDGGPRPVDGGFFGSVNCAFDAQSRGAPFTLHVADNGTDTGIQFVFLRQPDGGSEQVSQHHGHNPWPPFTSGDGDVLEQSCASFAPASNQAPTPLSCQSPGTETKACP
jgi:hypothetical protein